MTGQTAVRLKNGDELTGCWKGGKREGLGSIAGPRLEQVVRRTGQHSRTQAGAGREKDWAA